MGVGQSDSGDGEIPLPPEDLALFSGLAPEQVQEVARKKAQDYRSLFEGYIRQLNAIRNSAVPLHVRLPPELLMNIFKHLRPTRRSDIRITHVCQRWRRIIHRTPDVWVDFLGNPDLRLDAEERLLFVKRSAPRIIQLHLHPNIAFLKTIESHVHRISSLSITVGLTFPSPLSVLLDLDMPCLENLNYDVQSFRSFNPGDLIDELRGYKSRKGTFPRLIHLRAPTMFFNEDLAFPSLKQLTLYGNLLSCDVLLGALSRWPELRVLELVQLTVLWIDEAPSASPQTVFVNLHKLSIETACILDLWIPVALLANIVSPPTAFLRLSCGSHRLREVFPSIPPYPTLGMVERLSITFAWEGETRASIILRADGYAGKRQCLSLTVSALAWCEDDANSHSDVLRDLAQMFSRSGKVTSLELVFPDDLSVTQGDWAVFLEAFSSLTSFSVSIVSARNLLRIIRRDDTICPGLMTLSITCQNGSGVHELMTLAAEARSYAERPLQRLEFSCGSGSGLELSESRWKRLKAVVSDVVVPGAARNAGFA